MDKNRNVVISSHALQYTILYIFNVVFIDVIYVRHICLSTYVVANIELYFDLTSCTDMLRLLREKKELEVQHQHYLYN